MRTVFIIIILLTCSVALFAQGGKDLIIYTEWITIKQADDSTKSYDSWKEGNFIAVDDTLLVPRAYKKIQVQYRINLQGVVQQRLRFFRYYQ